MPFFQIVTEPTAPGSEVVRKRWVYRQGTTKNPGDAVCQSVGYFNDDSDCRRDITSARKLFGGAKFAKVE
jgi:hypothetical protein